MLALIAATFGALSTVYGIRRHDTRTLRQAPLYTWLCVGGAVLAVVMMQRALITRDFSLAYIQQVGSATTPRLYNIAAMWSALEGSILLWLVILAAFTAAVGWRFRKRTDDPLVGWALVVMFAVMAFFALLSFGPADPFANGVPGRNFELCILLSLATSNFDNRPFLQEQAGGLVARHQQAPDVTTQVKNQSLESLFLEPRQRLLQIVGRRFVELRDLDERNLLIRVEPMPPLALLIQRQSFDGWQAELRPFQSEALGFVSAKNLERHLRSRLAASIAVKSRWCASSSARRTTPASNSRAS
jgi:hypothetical protein